MTAPAAQSEASRRRGKALHLLLGHGLATVCALIFALNLSLVKVAREDLGPLELAAARFWLAGLLVLGVWAIRGWPKWGTWDRRTWRWIGVGAVLLGPIFMVTLNTGAAGTSAGMMGLLMATQALHMAWMGPAFVGESIGVRQLMALAVGFIGIAVPLTIGSAMAYTVWWAPVLVGLASGLGALNIVIPKVLDQRVKTLDIATTLMAISAVACLPLMGAQGEFHQFTQMRSMTIFAVLWLGTIGQIGVLLLWYTALRRLTAVTAALYLFVLMLAASGWGYVVLGQPPHWSEAIAAVIVVMALRLNAAGGRRGGQGEVPDEFDPLADKGGNRGE